MIGNYLITVLFEQMADKGSFIKSWNFYYMGNS